MKLRIAFVAYLVTALVTVVPAEAASSVSLELQNRPVPRPFPQPGNAEPEPNREPERDGARITSEPPPLSAAGGLDQNPAVPTEAALGLPVYPTAQFITSYEAGGGQQFHLFGTNSTFTEMINYYRVILDERGDRVFDAPVATHVFEVGRFREREMAFPPSVTIKDYTGNGSGGFLNPNGGEPAQFRTVIQLVPAPSGQANR